MIMLTVDNFDRSDIGEWKCAYIPEMGSLCWEHPEMDLVVFATPSYITEDETPVEIQYEDGNYEELNTYIHKYGSINEKNHYVRESLGRLFETLI